MNWGFESRNNASVFNSSSRNPQKLKSRQNLGLDHKYIEAQGQEARKTGSGVICCGTGILPV
jgi:hypothetical protein